MTDWEQHAKDLARVRDQLYARIDDLSRMLAKAQSERDTLETELAQARARIAAALAIATTVAFLSNPMAYIEANEEICKALSDDSQ